MRGWQDNIYFVLVEPKEPGNIGASARAIKNMGFRNLCLVNPPPEMTGEGKWFARNAHDVLDAAVIYPSVAEAIKDKALVAGTTRRRGRRRGIIMPAGEGASKLYKMAANNKVAILFGREARGLSNEEVEECGFMLTIPSSRIQPSLNLSHAVLIIAYELFLAEYGISEEESGRRPHVIPPDSDAAPALEGHGEIAGLYERISGALELLEYIPRGDRNIKKKIMVNLKHFIGRAGLTDWELKMLHGLCYQIEKKVGRR
jgi:TrmH family RNA methyltransferase